MRFGMCAHIVIRTGEANTAAAVRIVGEVPGTAAAGMNLGFDDPDGPPSSAAALLASSTV